MIEYTLVYKTYENDLDWLRYSLISVKKYIIDTPPIIIYYHRNCFDRLIEILSNLDLVVDLIPVDYDIHGYLKQMVIKCLCYQDVKSEYIMIMDCDVILKKEFDIIELFTDGKINWSVLRKNPNNESESLWSVWEKSIENMVNEKMITFYMWNGFPFVFKRQTLVDADLMFQSMHQMDYNTFCKFHLTRCNISCSDPLTGPDGKFPILATIFEEFEYLGWFAYNHTNDYNFIESLSTMTSKRTQYWSHGGITPKIDEEIKNFTK